MSETENTNKETNAGNCCQRLSQNLGFKLDIGPKGISFHLHPQDPKKATALQNLVQAIQELCPCDAKASCC